MRTTVLGFDPFVSFNIQHNHKDLMNTENATNFQINYVCFLSFNLLLRK